MLLKKESIDIIDKITKIIFSKYNINTNESVDVFYIARCLNFEFANISKNYEQKYKGILVLDPNNILKLSKTGRLIAFNKKLSDDENRKVLAHELGHYYLHYDQGKLACLHKYVENENEKNDEHELEANYFAASLLLPCNSILNYWNNNKKPIDEFIAFISKKYGVDEKCVLRRLKEIKVIQS